MTVGAATGQQPGPIGSNPPSGPTPLSSAAPAVGPQRESAINAPGAPAPKTAAGGKQGGGAGSAEEADLIRRAQAGDRAAFGAFVVATQDRLYTVLVRIIGDREEARELAQETYLKAFSSLASFRGDSAPYTWLYRVAVNLAIARLRKVRRHRVFSLDSGATSGTAVGGGGASVVRGAGGTDPRLGPEGQALAAEQARQVVAALGRLDSEYRTVLVLRDVDQLDYREIADVLQLPIGTVKSRLFRARLSLREELQRYMGTDQRRPATGTDANRGGQVP